MFYPVLAVGALFSLYFCIERMNGCCFKNLVLKTVSSLLFVLTAVAALIENGSALIYGALVIFGGVLGLAGDIVLDLKGIYPKDQKFFLNSGFNFFLVGHLFYIAAITISFSVKWYIIVASLIGGVVFAIVNLFASKLMKLEFGKFKLIVCLYSAILAATMILSICVCVISDLTKSSILLSLGAILFALSDVVLSGTYFGKGKDGPVFLFINHILYYAGQFLIASSIMFI